MTTSTSRSGQDHDGRLVDEHDHMLALSEGRLRPAFELRIERLPLPRPRLHRIGLHQQVARGGSVVSTNLD
jgi:hypothetical protein